MSIISGFSASRMDVLPYCKGEGRPPIPHGINAIGLKRKGVTPEERESLKSALKILMSEKYLISDAAKVIEDTIPTNKYIKHLVEFIRSSKRGVVIRKKEVTL